MPEGFQSNRLKAFIGLIKPELPIAAGICVVTGQLVSLGDFPSIEQVVWGFLVGFLLSGSAMVSNDYFDLEVDRVNRPTRPLPSGSVTKKEVVLLTVFLSLAGILSATFLGFEAFTFALIIWTAGILYNWKIKENGIAGNLLVAFSVASTFLFGGLSVGGLNDPMIWIFAAIAFIFDLAEEISSGAMDIEGDTLRGSRSIAILKGKEYAIRVSGVLLALLMILSLTPFLAGWVGIPYLIIISFTIVLLIVVYHRLYISQTPEEGRKQLRYLYIVMMCFIVAFIINAML